jgi:hypothetical protein
METEKNCVVCGTPQREARKVVSLNDTDVIHATCLIFPPRRGEEHWVEGLTKFQEASKSVIDWVVDQVVSSLSKLSTDGATDTLDKALGECIPLDFCHEFNCPSHSSKLFELMQKVQEADPHKIGEVLTWRVMVQALKSYAVDSLVVRLLPAYEMRIDGKI